MSHLPSFSSPFTSRYPLLKPFSVQLLDFVNLSKIPFSYEFISQFSCCLSDFGYQLLILHRNRGLGKRNLTDIVHERHPHPIEANFDPVAGLEGGSIGEGELHRPEEVQVNVAGEAELGILEMVVFEIGEAVTHLVFAREQLA